MVTEEDSQEEDSGEGMEEDMEEVLEDTDDNLLRKYSSIKVLLLNKSVPVFIQ